MGCGAVTKFAEEHLIPGVEAWVDNSEDFHGAGIKAKIVRMSCGDEVIQHKHQFPHLSILLSGRVMVKTDNREWQMSALDGPTSTVIEAGIYHALKALTDNVVWMCINESSGVQ